MRKLAAAALSFSAAIFLSIYLLPPAWAPWCAAAAAAAALPAGALLKGEARLRALLILLGASAGLVWHTFYRAVFVAPAEALAGRTKEVSALVASYPVATDYGSKMNVLVSCGGMPPVSAALYAYGESVDARPGDEVRFTARFSLADTVYGERTEAYFASGVFLRASAKGEVLVVRRPAGIAFLPARVARAASLMAGLVFPGDCAGLVRALLLGDSSGVYADDRLSAALRSTGTAHIVSASGMNVAFIVGLVRVLVRNRRALPMLALPLVFAFMAVVGFTPPITRAGAMQMFFLLAPLVRRESDDVTSLFASLALLLIINPFSAASAGLQLSFASTLGILLFADRIYLPAVERMHKLRAFGFLPTRWLMRAAAGSLASTLSSLVFSAPLTALHFGSVPLIALIANALITIPVAIAFFGGAASIAAGFVFLPAGTALGAATAIPARLALCTVYKLSQVPNAAAAISNPAVVIWLVYTYLLLVAAFALRLKPRRLVLPGCLSAIALCAALVLTAAASASRPLAVTALDVGQGQCIAISSGRYTAVVDCGSASGKAAGAILSDFLRGAGRTRVDLLILTHFHADHAGGVPELLELVPVGAIAAIAPSASDYPLAGVIAARAEEKGIPFLTVSEDLLAHVGAAEIRLFSPRGDGDENERGLCVLCSEGGFDALITGDLSAKSESLLLSTAELPDIELLFAGHHGSKYSTSDELLYAVSPEAAVISVGHNTYGHPSPETLERLSRHGIPVYRTDELGSVTVRAG